MATMLMQAASRTEWNKILIGIDRELALTIDMLLQDKTRLETRQVYTCMYNKIFLTFVYLCITSMIKT